MAKTEKVNAHVAAIRVKKIARASVKRAAVNRVVVTVVVNANHGANLRLTIVAQDNKEKI